ncbi:unnamed protein product [Nesidiocoris tenuis]|uniref:LITAF domain-containing protein n=1 Tax=Nesidiocoris tenuis TaxID=355587 RepID=A0A6H5G6T5_9HEMI|nr:unnamed protein product [Nesidiocoris tenuis]
MLNRISVVMTELHGSILSEMNFGPESQSCVCPHCHSNVQTKVKREATTKTHLFALLICLLFCPCFWLPYCCDSCQATNHYCPNCNNFLGKYDS